MISYRKHSIKAPSGIANSILFVLCNVRFNLHKGVCSQSAFAVSD